MILIAATDGGDRQGSAAEHGGKLAGGLDAATLADHGPLVVGEVVEALHAAAPEAMR